jgi:hypothetical protein
MIKLGLVAIVFCTVAACEGGGACTDEFRFGLQVSVTDASGAPVCDAMVIARDGTYAETLDAELCMYHGAGERGGTYEITATLGTRMAKVTQKVGENDCHVIQEMPAIVLP